MYDLSELQQLLHVINSKVPIIVDEESLDIVDLNGAIQALTDLIPDLIADFVEWLPDIIARLVQEIKAYLETVQCKEVPEDDDPGVGKYCPCSRQLPGGHRIPWYTSGFQ